MTTTPALSLLVAIEDKRRGHDDGSMTPVTSDVFVAWDGEMEYYTDLKGQTPLTRAEALDLIAAAIGDDTVYSMTNMADVTYVVGDYLEGPGGWKGTLHRIDDKRGLLFVIPDDMSALPSYLWHTLNPEAAARHGHEEFCKPRDQGMSMGNFAHVAA